MEWQAEIAAGGTPTGLFEDQDYLNAQFGDYQHAVAQAEALTRQSQQAGATSSHYVITTILLATALFFTGVTSSFRYQPARVLLVLLAVGTVAVAAARLGDLPIA